MKHFDLNGQGTVSFNITEEKQKTCQFIAVRLIRSGVGQGKGGIGGRGPLGYAEPRGLLIAAVALPPGTLAPLSYY